MGYEGGSLVDLFKPATTRAPTRRLLRTVASRGGEELTRRAAAHTPRDSGATAEAWEQLPVEEAGRTFTSGARNAHFPVHLLEYGVQEHDLEPNDAEALDTPEGPRAGAHHPGFEGHHMLGRAMAETEAMWPEAAQPALSRWAAEIEANAKRHKGIT